jgi:hypothetical protein
MTLKTGLAKQQTSAYWTFGIPTGGNRVEFANMSRRTTRLQTGALVPVQLDPFSDTLVWKTKMHASDAYAESQAYHEMAQDRNLKRLRIPSSEGVPLSPSEAANATYFAAEIHPEDGWEPYPPESVDDMDGKST